MMMNLEPYLVRRITLEEEESLQGLCERCSDYYEIVEGRAPRADAAHEIITELPLGKEYDDKFVLGIYNHYSSLVGVIDLVRNYPREGIWTIGLLLLDPCERGKGLGRRVQEALVKTASESGAKTLRIGVASDNHRAFDFWTTMHYTKQQELPLKLGLKESTVVIMHYDIHQ